MGALKIDFEALLMKINAIGDSRELAIAKTKLEESCMWAIKHLTK
jgi:hypothetical protein